MGVKFVEGNSKQPTTQNKNMWCNFIFYIASQFLQESNFENKKSNNETQEKKKFLSFSNKEK